MAADAEPIYEEISESPTPPPLPTCPPPDRADHEPATALPCRSIFEGATKYDIINYLVDAKRRCGSLHDTSACHPKFVVVTDEQAAGESDACSGGAFNDSGEESSSYSGCGPAVPAMLQSADAAKRTAVDIERNDSGVGSETSQSSRSKWQQQQQQQQQHETQHSCEDCDQPVEIQTTDG